MIRNEEGYIQQKTCPKVVPIRAAVQDLQSQVRVPCSEAKALAEMVPHTHWGKPGVARHCVPGMEKLSVQTGQPGVGACSEQGMREVFWGLVMWKLPPDWKLNCSHFFVAGAREKDIFVGKSKIVGLGP